MYNINFIFPDFIYVKERNNLIIIIIKIIVIKIIIGTEYNYYYPCFRFT